MRWGRRQGHDRLLVTILMGDAFTTEWEQHCQTGWERYAERHGYDLLVFDAPLDPSPPGLPPGPQAGRSAWSSTTPLCRPTPVRCGWTLTCSSTR